MLLKFYWSSKTSINSYINHEEFASVNIARQEKKSKILWNIPYKYGWYKQRNVLKK